MTSLDDPSGAQAAAQAHQAGAVLRLAPFPPSVRVSIEFRAQGGMDRAKQIADLAAVELLTVAGVDTVIVMVHE